MLVSNALLAVTRRHQAYFWSYLHGNKTSALNFSISTKGRLENRGGTPMGVQIFLGVKKR